MKAAIMKNPEAYNILLDEEQAVKEMNYDWVRYLSEEQIKKLEPQQLKHLDAEQIKRLDAEQLKHLDAEQIKRLDAEQLKHLDAEQLKDVPKVTIIQLLKKLSKEDYEDIKRVLN